MDSELIDKLIMKVIDSMGIKDDRWNEIKKYKDPYGLFKYQTIKRIIEKKTPEKLESKQKRSKSALNQS